MVSGLDSQGRFGGPFFFIRSSSGMNSGRRLRCVGSAAEWRVFAFEDSQALPILQVILTVIVKAPSALAVEAQRIPIVDRRIKRDHVADQLHHAQTWIGSRVQQISK
jgi:hypothetical protein